MPTTAKGLRYPASSAAPNVPQDIQNLASDVDKALSTSWTNLLTSDTAYTYALSSFNTWVALPGTTVSTPVVPTGKQLEAEFTAPISQVAGGFLYLRLLINNVQCDTIGTSASGATWFPLRLAGHLPGTGAAMTIVVQAQLTAGTGDVRAVAGGTVRVRYRIL